MEVCAAEKRTEAEEAPQHPPSVVIVNGISIPTTCGGDGGCAAMHAHDLERAVGVPELKLLDVGFSNTAVCESKITFTDGENGVLRYRGYPIEELAEKSTFLEVAFLLVHGELPTVDQLDTWTNAIMSHTYVHENLLRYLRSFRYDAHPMGMFISAVSVMSTYHAEANPSLAGRDIYDDPDDEERTLRNKQMYRILGKLPTIAACALRHRMGRPYNYPDATGTLSYTENFLAMIDGLSEPAYRPHPALAKALDVLFIVHADHELNCSTAALRHLASTRVDPYTGVAAAAAALYGPLHGGASEGVVRMLERIGTVDAVPAFLARVRAKEELLVGFGHRVYRALDPRARILQRYADEVFAVVGRGDDRLMDVGLALADAARRDDYFVSRRLYPNVDFYSGLIYRALGFPLDAFPLLFALPRAAGWLAHWSEALDADDAVLVRAGATRVTRPTQVWGGGPVPTAGARVCALREHVSFSTTTNTADADDNGSNKKSEAPLASVSSGTSVRRRAAAASAATVAVAPSGAAAGLSSAGPQSFRPFPH